MFVVLFIVLVIGGRSITVANPNVWCAVQRLHNAFASCYISLFAYLAS
jgi:hypothetical protein